MALGLAPPLAPDPWLLGAAVLADLALGDPDYRLHPVRMMGTTLARIEAGLRAIGADGYAGGVALFVLLAAFWTAVWSAVVIVADGRGHVWGAVAHVFVLYSLLALGSLLHHAWRVEHALVRGDLPAARAAVANLVGRDTDRMDEAACRRAVIESLGESLTDGFTSAVFWYALAGLPGLVVFKVVSTMDSMVGYKTPRHLRFGWCGARLDDLMNYLPARITWLLVAAAAVVVPGASPLGALRIGWRDHGVLPSPNSGWPEAATAGAIRRRLIGPIWRNGQQVTDIWIGAAEDPPAATHADVVRASALITIAGLFAVTLAVVGLALFR